MTSLLSIKHLLLLYHQILSLQKSGFSEGVAFNMRQWENDTRHYLGIDKGSRGGALYSGTFS